MMTASCFGVSVQIPVIPTPLVNKASSDVFADPHGFSESSCLTESQVRADIDERAVKM